MKHIEVYIDLRKKILDKEYAPGSALESEEILCKKYNISRPTLQKAVAHLKQDGFVHSRQGSGIYVNPSEFHKQNNLETVSERFGSKGANIANEVLLFEKVTCGDLKDIFHMDKEELLIHYQRVRIIDGERYTCEETYMPEYLFPNLEEKDLDGSMIYYIEQICDYRISHDIKTVSPINLDKRMSNILDLEENLALLEVKHLVYLTRNVLAQYTIEITKESEIRIASIR